MNSAGDTITTTRDVDAILIPLGTPVTIPAGAMVLITQELGGTYTVSVSGNLARVEGKDADALGLGGNNDEISASDTAKTVEPAASGSVDEQAIWDVLKTCYDPEIPVNIVDLGLVYDVHIVETDEGTNHVDIVMTLTAPGGCGRGESGTGPFTVSVSGNLARVEGKDADALGLGGNNDEISAADTAKTVEPAASGSVDE